MHLVQGLFNESIPRFRESKPSLPPLSYLHIDCDLYEGSKDALFLLNDLIVPGVHLESASIGHVQTTAIQARCCSLMSSSIMKNGKSMK